MRSWAGTSSQRAWCRSWQTCSASGWLAACQCTASGQWFAAHTTSHPAIAAPVENPPAPANRSIAFMIALHLLQHEPGIRLGLADFLNCGKQGLGVRLDVTPRADHLAEHGAQLGVLLFEIGDALGRISGEKVSCHTLTLPPAAVMASRNRACISLAAFSRVMPQAFALMRARGTAYGIQWVIVPGNTASIVLSPL